MSEARDSGPLEQACPNCGEPMLAGWGSTCGRCKPSIAYPKTIMLVAGDVQGMLPMVLGWMAVLRTASDSQRGMLIELNQPVTVLTRSGSGTAGAEGRPIEIDDAFMSAGHALVRKPRGLAGEAFTIEDRKAPGPSANGTWVNGRRLAAGEVAKLGDGDVVRVGITELQFRSLFLPAGGAA